MSDYERIQNAIEYVALAIHASKNKSALRPLMKRLLDEEAKLLNEDPVMRRVAEMAARNAEIAARNSVSEKSNVVRLRKAS